MGKCVAEADRRTAPAGSTGIQETVRDSVIQAYEAYEGGCRRPEEPGDLDFVGALTQPAARFKVFRFQTGGKAPTLSGRALTDAGAKRMDRHGATSKKLWDGSPRTRSRAFAPFGRGGRAVGSFDAW